MAEPEKLFSILDSLFLTSNSLSGKKFLITAGPTYELIDPVRFIGNHSSGKMGYAIASTILNRGGEVILISGPTKLDLKHPKLNLIRVQSAQNMLDSVQSNWSRVDVGIFSAAVADYRPISIVGHKIKKSDENLTIELVKNPDILGWAGSNKKNGQLLIGFALETNDGKQYAQDKLARKNLDFIVLNTLEDQGAGFGHDTNKISIFDNHNNFTSFELKTKVDVAIDIVDYMQTYLK
jgi:phosphopantothenoylcysteine decarboxylase/phosphopantothenate--cysteine ligase